MASPGCPTRRLLRLNSAMQNGSRSLDEFPLEIVRIDCQRCRRAQIAEELRIVGEVQSARPAKFFGGKKGQPTSRRDQGRRQLA